MAEIAERLSLLPPPHPECGRTETWVKHSDGREDPSHESGSGKHIMYLSEKLNMRIENHDFW